MCSRHKISLCRGGPGGPRGLYREKGFVKVDGETLALIATRAEQKGTTVDAVAERVLKYVARDNLYDAVIDDPGLV